MKRSLTLVSALIANFFLCATSSAQLSDALMLTVSSGTYRDQTAVRFLDVATNYFDRSWDAYKLKNRGNTPNFYSSINDQIYSINALHGSRTDINQDLTLKLEVAFSGTYTITAEQIGLFDSTCAITLVDHFSETVLDLKAYPTYTFVSHVGDPIDRFTISFNVINTTTISTTTSTDTDTTTTTSTGVTSIDTTTTTTDVTSIDTTSTDVTATDAISTTTTTTDVASTDGTTTSTGTTAINPTAEDQGIKIYNNQGTIIVELGSTPSSSQVMVRDLSGNSIVQSAMGSSVTETWNYTPQENGIYIVSLIMDGNMYTEKLYVQ